MERGSRKDSTRNGNTKLQKVENSIKENSKRVFDNICKLNGKTSIT